MNMNDDYRMLIDGKLVGAADTIPVINPATEEVIAHAPSASEDQLETAVKAARRAFPAWSAQPLATRQQAIAEIGALVESSKSELMRLLTSEQGKPEAGADWEIGGTIAWCQEFSKMDLATEIVEDSDERHVEIRHVPLGVVGAITPWNYPVLLSIWKILPSILAGNTIVLKPSPYTPLTMLKLGELIAEVVPPGVINIVSGGNDLGKWMTAHPDINKISFTGSTQTGKAIYQNVAGTIKRLTLELGGNDAAIVLADVDPKEVAEQLFWAAFQNSSQLCVATKRMYIQSDIYDAVAHELVEFAKTVKVGDGAMQGSQLGPVQNKMQFEKVKNLIESAHASGDKFLLGGEVADGPGYFIPISIVDNPSDDSRVVVEEAFGPVLPLLKFDDVQDAIRRANDTTQGLGGSVWSSDLSAAREVAERLECGMVWINEIHTFSPHQTFGGHKESGLGVEGSRQGLLEYTNPQTIVTKRVVAAH